MFSGSISVSKTVNKAKVKQKYEFCVNLLEQISFLVHEKLKIYTVASLCLPSKQATLLKIKISASYSFKGQLTKNNKLTESIEY